MLFGRAVLREVNGIPLHPGGTWIAAEVASAQYDDSGAPATRIPFSINSSPFKITSSVIDTPFGNELKVIEVIFLPGVSVGKGVVGSSIESGLSSILYNSIDFSW